jgi:starvation-inducible DNA-binding protein
MMHPTFNPLPEGDRRQIVVILNQLVADCISLTYAAKQAHWNVKGAEFISVHRLFDEVYDLASELTDAFAEAVISLGGQAYGTVEYAAQESRLPLFPLDQTEPKGLITEVVKRLAAVSAYLIEAIGQTATLDLTTQNDLMTAQAKVNKYIYFLESHLLQ